MPAERLTHSCVLLLTPTGFKIHQLVINFSDIQKAISHSYPIFVTLKTSMKPIPLSLHSLSLHNIILLSGAKKVNVDYMKLDSTSGIKQIHEKKLVP